MPVSFHRLVQPGKIFPGNENSATKGGSPSVVTNAQNGLSVMHYTGNGQRHKFTMINDIRTVFGLSQSIELTVLLVTGMF